MKIALILFLLPLFAQANDTIPRPVFPTTFSKEPITEASIMLTKPDGSIIIIDSIWRLVIRREKDRVVIIYPDSSRVIHRVVDRPKKDTIITIPFNISKKQFDGAQNIKLEIIR